MPDPGAATLTRPDSAAAAADEILRVEDLAVHFALTSGILLRRRTATVKAVDGVSFTLKRGETLGLVGESGCGKSTTGLAILRMAEPTAGRIVFEGEDITRHGKERMRAIRRRMQMVYQDPYGSLNPRMTARDIIGEPLDVHEPAMDREAYRARVAELIRLVGLLPDMAERYPHEFSGGQRQRIGIARALALNPSLVVCDEPVSALDVSIQAQVVNLFMELQQRLGLTYIFIAHNLAVVRHISDRIAVMYLGRMVEIARRDELYRRPCIPIPRRCWPRSRSPTRRWRRPVRAPSCAARCRARSTRPRAAASIRAARRRSTRAGACPPSSSISAAGAPSRVISWHPPSA
jgi:oligopeptide transport system ATP-binding protein